MNLYERLKPEVKEKIENYQYPTIKNHLIEELKEKRTILHLTFENAMNITEMNNDKIYKLDIITLKNYFS